MHINAGKQQAVTFVFSSRIQWLCVSLGDKDVKVRGMAKEKDSTVRWETPNKEKQQFHSCEFDACCSAPFSFPFAMFYFLFPGLF